MAEVAASIIALVNFSVRVVEAYHIIQQSTAQQALVELGSELEKLYFVLQRTQTISRKWEKDPQWGIIELLQSSHSTARQLHNLLPDSIDGGDGGNTIDNLTPSITLISMAASRVRFDSWHDCLADNSLRCQFTRLDIGLQTLQEHFATCELPPKLNCKTSGDGLHQLQPVDILTRAQSRLSPIVDRVVKAVAKLSSYRASKGLKRAAPDNVTLPSLDTAKEYVDCAAWFLEQISVTSARLQLRRRPRRLVPRSRQSRLVGQQVGTIALASATKSNIQPPLHAAQRFFWIRAVCCIRGSLRRLSGRELFAAVTTRILADDLHWPFGPKPSELNIRELLQLCRDFIREDERGFVSFNDDCEAYFMSAQSPVTELDAQLFLALVCLQHLKTRPRLVLKPWLDYHKLEKEQANFPLHRYISSFWQEHCREAELASSKVNDGLHVIIQAAWISLRDAKSFVQCAGTVKELDILFVQGEALDIGLGMSIELGFRSLADTYRRMGANESGGCSGREVTGRGAIKDVGPNSSTESFEVLSQSELEIEEDWVIVELPSTDVECDQDDHRLAS